MTHHEVDLGEAAGEAAAVERFWRLAKAYVLLLGADDSFRVDGRVRGDEVRRLTWSPGEGPSVLSGYLRDYQEYFEGITFPAVDPDTAAAAGLESAQGAVVRGRGVGLAVLTIEGAEAFAGVLERLASTAEPSCAEQLPPGPRARRMRMYEATWKSRKDGVDAIREGLEDEDAAVVATAAMLVGRYRLGELLDRVHALLDDPRATARKAALGALKAVDDGAAVVAAIGLLTDGDGEVREAAFAALRHVSHMPWARRRAVMDEAASGLAQVLDLLDGPLRAEALEWTIGCTSEAAVDLALIGGHDVDSGVRRKALEVLAAARQPRALAGVVAAISDPDEAIGVAAVEALGREDVRMLLQSTPDLLADALKRLQRAASPHDPDRGGNIPGQEGLERE